ncbi:MAG: glycosyltransferase [Nitrospirae bacterium]|nr:glycosyltransferase [Nitrospirota bacterium]
MRILMICTNDPAGMGIAFTDAINRHTEHSCRLVTTAVKYNFNYRKDIHVPESSDVERPLRAPALPRHFPLRGGHRTSNVEEIEQVLRDADLFHFHAFADEETPLGPFRAKDFMKGKRAIYHQHGEPLRSDPARFRAQSSRRTFLVSTPDLLDFLPEATWIPNLVPIDDPLYLPHESRVATHESRVRIGQSPTKKEIKDTELLVRVYAGLKARYNGFLDLDLIENVPHSECLERKRNCHIFFDHLQGYFGVSSLEALSQGTPTIARLAERTRSEAARFAGTDALPWLAAGDSAELETVLGRLISDGDHRMETGRNSREFMVQHWHPRKIVDALMVEYRRL